MNNIDEYLRPLAAELKANRNEENAAHMVRYMKGQFAFFGIQRPKRREILQSFVAKHGHPGENEAPLVLESLWKFDEREFQYCGLDILYKAVKTASESFEAVLDRLITEKSWWDTVDMIAQNGCGPHLHRFPSLRDAAVYRWLSSENIWLNRTAILFQNRYKNRTDRELLADVVLRFIESDEFFHQKAIGWSLREYAKTDPEWVVALMAKHTFKPLAEREALKYLKRKQ